MNRLSIEEPCYLKRDDGQIVGQILVNHYFPTKNALKRFVACWNALVAFSTDMIEKSEVDLVQLQRDAARYRWLREKQPVIAQAMFWNVQSRKERDKAIDAAIREDAISKGAAASPNTSASLEPDEAPGT